jgi:hypothetical protein
MYIFKFFREILHNLKNTYQRAGTQQSQSYGANSSKHAETWWPKLNVKMYKTSENAMALFL